MTVEEQLDAAYQEWVEQVEKLRHFWDATPPKTCVHCQQPIVQGWLSDELVLCEACMEDYGK